MGWMAALGVALTGRELPEGEDTGDGPPSPPQVLAALAHAGFDRTGLAELVATRQAAEQPWPFPVDVGVRGDIGAAQFFSVLRDVTDALDVHTWRRAKPTSATALTADDRRLLGDRPPHWG